MKFIFMIFFMLSLKGYSALYGTQDVPLELSKIVESLSTNNTQIFQSGEMLDTLLDIDLFIEKIPKEEFLVLTKAEIYKYILNLFNNNISGDQSDLISKIKRREKLPPFKDPFLNWLSASVETELVSALLSKNMIDIDAAKRTKKVSIMLKIYSFLSASKEEELAVYFTPKLKELLLRLEVILRHFIHLSMDQELKKRTNLAYFKVTTPALPANAESSLEKIDAITSESKTSVPGETWVPSERAQDKIKFDPNYVPPKILPTPIAGWDVAALLDDEVEKPKPETFQQKTTPSAEADPDDIWLLDE